MMVFIDNIKHEKNKEATFATCSYKKQPRYARARFSVYSNMLIPPPYTHKHAHTYIPTHHSNDSQIRLPFERVQAYIFNISFTC